MIPSPRTEASFSDKTWPLGILTPSFIWIAFISKVSTALDFHTAPRFSSILNVFPPDTFLQSCLPPSFSHIILPFYLPTPDSSPPIKSLLFPLPREIYVSLLVLSAISNLSGPMDCSLVIIYLMVNIHM